MNVTCRDREFHAYLWLLLGSVSIISAVIFSCFAIQKGDHFAAVTRSDNSAWYQNLGGEYVTEIQDQDLFFHNVGASIENARRADIIILGSSLVSFAVNEQVIRDRLEGPYAIRFYNMAFLGVASGEFSRQIIGKYNIHPRLWIINADDGGGGGNFFGRNLSRAFGADVKQIPATLYGKMHARYEIVRRDLRWRVEQFGVAAGILSPKAGFAPMFYRNDEDGAADMSEFPRLLDEGNPVVKMIRDPNCHTTPEVVDSARSFVRSLGAPVVLTLVPNLHGCLTQMREIARAVGLDVAESGRTDYSAWDGGGHLDRNGSIAFTNDLVTALEETPAFRAIWQRDASRR